MIHLHDRAFLRVAFSLVMLAAGAVPASAAFMQYLTDIGSGPGSAVGELNAPSGIAAFSSPTERGIYISDTNNNRIQQFTFGPGGGFSIFAGATAGTAVGQVNQPRGVAVDGDGAVYVADTLNNRIQVNTGGTPADWSIIAGQGTAVGSVNAPRGLDAIGGASTGVLYVADTLNNRLQTATPGSGTFTWTQVGGPGIALGQFSQPSSLDIADVDRDGNPDRLFVADTGNNRIQRATIDPITGDTNFDLLMFPGFSLGQVNAPQGVTVALRRLANPHFPPQSGTGLIFVADTGNNRIQMGVQSGGSIAWSLVAGPGSGPGQVLSPRDVALADFTGDGRRDLIVADTGNNRVQVYVFVPEPATFALVVSGIIFPLAGRWRRTQ
jgi:hypothetical protein